MIRFSDNLFLTDAVRPKINSIKFRLYSGIGLAGTHLITFAENSDDVFDIYPAYVFKQRQIRKRDFFIIGVAEDYGSAVALVSNLINQCIEDGGSDTNIREYYLQRVQGI